MASAFKQYKFLGLITVLSVTFLTLSNATAGKIVQIGPLVFSITVYYFPVTFIIADVLTEVYGYAQARKVTWYLFFTSIVSSFIFWLVSVIPPAEGFQLNDSYVTVFGQAPRIFVGSWLAIWAGSHLNNFVLAKMKVLTKGKYLWSRTIGSTIAGEGADTIIFYIVALYGVIPHGMLIYSILSGWLLKVTLEALFTPLTYKIVSYIKKAENEDCYDDKTNFNPFVL